jgi:TRAP-type mannitol/chloroaromatic compound transport system permease large subunit
MLERGDDRRLARGAVLAGGTLEILMIGHHHAWSAAPFIALQALGLALGIIFPQIILWMPPVLHK